MKEYEDVTFIPIEEDTSFSKYKEEKAKEERKKSKNFVKIGLKILLIFFGIIFLAPIAMGSILFVSGLGMATAVGSVVVIVGGMASLVFAVFLMSGGWVSLGMFCLFVALGCISVCGLILTLCIWIVRSIVRACVGRYKAWKYRNVEVEEVA